MIGAKRKAAYRAGVDRARGFVMSDSEWELMFALNDLKENARLMLSKAVKIGTIQRMPCEVCGGPGEGHHADYTQPYAVIWLCHAHHGKEHARVNRLSPDERIADAAVVTARARSAMLQNLDHMQAVNLIDSFL